MQVLIKTLPALLLIIIPLSCGYSEKGTSLRKEFGDYWYQGKAEITSYDLQQARYGEIHEGDAVLIFVTEDFSKEQQVKLNDPKAAGDDAVKVLKLNFTKKFVTGIYPYSMMMSVFTPVERNEFPHSLKVTTSSQEWCGHTFTQLNLEENAYRAHLFSYFESEGDQQKELPKTWLEDELWNIIRIAPQELPQGEIELIPGTFFQRLSHQKLELHKATALVSSHPSDEKLNAYTLQFSSLNRSLSIYFNKKFPHEIQGWEETMKSGFGENAKTLTTKATLKERVMTDYWAKNSPGDKALRKELGLEEK